MPRKAFDLYETPPHYVDGLVRHIGIPEGTLYEPCVGNGHIVRRLRALGCRPTDRLTNDLNPTMRADTHHDATDALAWGALGVDWCITNPPFSHEQAILEYALQWSRNVAFLARLSFLEPTADRRPFWKAHAASCQVIVLPRYSFRLNDAGKRATDNLTCCWLVWRRGRKEIPQGLRVYRRRIMRQL